MCCGAQRLPRGEAAGRAGRAGRAAGTALPRAGTAALAGRCSGTRKARGRSRRAGSGTAHTAPTPSTPPRARLQHPGAKGNRQQKLPAYGISALPAPGLNPAARAPLPAGGSGRSRPGHGARSSEHAALSTLSLPELPPGPNRSGALRPRHSPLTRGSPGAGRAPCVPAAAPAAFAPRPGTRHCRAAALPLCPGGSRRFPADPGVPALTCAGVPQARPGRAAASFRRSATSSSSSPG